jgi:hypothetical protein
LYPTSQIIWSNLGQTCDHLYLTILEPWNGTAGQYQHFLLPRPLLLLLLLLEFAVNQAPTYTPGPAVITVPESSGLYNASWASDVSAGPSDADVGQAVSFSVTCDAAAALFSQAPAVSPSGVLSFAPAAYQAGSSKCNVTLEEDGAGGLSVMSLLTIVVTAGETAGNSHNAGQPLHKHIKEGGGAACQLRVC